MNIKEYQKLIRGLISEGIEVKGLTLIQISESIKLYKLLAKRYK